MLVTLKEIGQAMLGISPKGSETAPSSEGKSHYVSDTEYERILENRRQLQVGNELGRSVLFSDDYRKRD